MNLASKNASRIKLVIFTIFALAIIILMWFDLGTVSGLLPNTITKIVISALLIIIVIISWISFNYQSEIDRLRK